MRTGARWSIAILAAIALLAVSAAGASARTGGRPAHGGRGGPGHHGGGGGDRGAGPGRGENLFRQAGYSPRAVDAKIRAAWQQLFHGTPGTEPTRGDGQRIFYHLGPSMAYVEDIGNQDVRTEGMGYAMMLAVQLGHRRAFDELWNFAYTKMEFHSGPQTDQFAWHTSTSGQQLSTGDAPDGDQWIAAALVFAGDRWGSGPGIDDYTAQAQGILHAMWHEADYGGVPIFSTASHDLPAFSPPGAVDFTDPSYGLPAFYRVFASADPGDAALWQQAVVASEGLLQDSHNPANGLTADNTNFDGTPYTTPSDTADSYDHTFQEDAWRVIANANIDADWWGVQPWQTAYSNELEQFFAGRPGGVTGYVSRYHLDGTPVTNGQNTYEPAHAQGLVAMNSTSAITATTPERLAFVRDLWNTAIPSGQARYYDGMLYFLGLLYDSGNFRDWQAAGHIGHAGRS